MINSYLNEVWENLFWQGMEAVLYGNGDIWVRQQGTQAWDEGDIIYKLPLSLDYWGDSYFVSTDEDGDLVKDETMKPDFIEDMTRQIKEGY
ncbi:hypothetical protein [Tetragenococcus koreensis]|uniref:Uncharacterized protein n=1 Tax=Tetragenococcus koreensis TaxID=290335 RepID=A0AAN4UCE7_9ENTE|nr:hypothetical protein [Tetragenococcus koreensis]MDN6291632.1 hypothetical protein [Tetragenococcus halophilus]MDN6640901.1 hypothetical protein [Tetragenococcus sp.]MCF1584567.1 hypothetical protein [Tetragenococcus koreensis]MCF1628890.1 hypothetical protein [Tetragenococcus koreensis]MCF1641918.1 hypothetical protein [Tetragenococcus koreensis]